MTKMALREVGRRTRASLKLLVKEEAKEGWRNASSPTPGAQTRYSHRGLMPLPAFKFPLRQHEWLLSSVIGVLAYKIAVPDPVTARHRASGLSSIGGTPGPRGRCAW